MKPFELVICSGKGGTGKTSVTASLAVLADRPAVADCDVDAADLFLLLEPDVKRDEPFVAGRLASIDSARCLDCGMCREVCNFGAVAEDGAGALRIDPLSCEGCGVCVRFCPGGAIDFPERECGRWFVSETRCGPMVHAKLAAGGENSGKLVSLVREQARRKAEETDRELVLVDGPPGIGCPVISALTGADMLLAVAEPTVSGRHDMERLLELARHFEVPAAVCINKWDLDAGMTEGIAGWCAERDIPVLGRIPYDKSVTAAQLAGVSVVENGPSPAADAVNELWIAVSGELRQMARKENQ